MKTIIHRLLSLLLVVIFLLTPGFSSGFAAMDGGEEGESLLSMDTGMGPDDETIPGSASAEEATKSEALSDGVDFGEHGFESVEVNPDEGDTADLEKTETSSETEAEAEKTGTAETTSDSEDGQSDPDGEASVSGEKNERDDDSEDRDQTLAGASDEADEEEKRQEALIRARSGLYSVKKAPSREETDERDEEEEEDAGPTLPAGLTGLTIADGFQDRNISIRFSDEEGNSLSAGAETGNFQLMLLLSGVKDREGHTLWPFVASRPLYRLLPQGLILGLNGPDDARIGPGLQRLPPLYRHCQQRGWRRRGREHGGVGGRSARGSAGLLPDLRTGDASERKSEADVDLRRAQRLLRLSGGRRELYGCSALFRQRRDGFCA